MSMTPAERMRSCADLIGARGDVPNPWDYFRRLKSTHEIGDYLAMLDVYFHECGVRHFTAIEACTMSSSSQKVAKRMRARKSIYRDQYIEPITVWHAQPMAALLVGFADPIRDALGAPITLRNGFRSWSINQQVAKSGIGSDHPMTACVDLDLSKDGDLKAAHAKARELYDKHADTFETSIGQGDTVIHFGIYSPMGHREWKY